MTPAKVQTFREPKCHDWVLTMPVRARFDRIVARLQQLHEDEPEAMTLREEIKRLPGFPREARPWDTIEFVMESKVFSLPSRSN